MKKLVGYTESELVDTLHFLLSHIEEMDSEIHMMEEQGLGIRDNLDWESSGKRLRINLEQIKRGLDLFNLEQIPFNDLNQFNYENHQKKIKDHAFQPKFKVQP